jgi:phosphoribosylaminoimidazole-succinocarboxamide synthase
VGLLGGERFTSITLSWDLLHFSAALAVARGRAVEFGIDANGFMLGDEVLTAGTSSFWPADRYVPAGPPPSFDKQFVSDFCDRTGWDKGHPCRKPPPEISAATRARYGEGFERLTGIPFANYLGDSTVVFSGP